MLGVNTTTDSVSQSRLAPNIGLEKTAVGCWSNPSLHKRVSGQSEVLDFG
jgi:hypothetical protein